jgi:tRNA(fMet)-specific endonuclease VapC
VPFLFDTSALSIAMSKQRIARHPAYAEWLRALPRRDQFTCTTVVGELRFGARHDPLRRQSLEARIDELLSRLTIVSYDLATTEHYAAVRADLNSRGMVIGEADMQIAACALEHHCAVVTANIKDFERVDGLQIHGIK